MKRRVLSVIALVAAPVLAVAAFLVSYYFDPLSFSHHSSIVALPAFLFSIVVLLIGQGILARQELLDSKRHTDRIYRAVRNYLHITKVGTPVHAFEYMLSRLPGLEEVKNTSFTTEFLAERAEEKFYESPEYVNASAKIADATHRGVRWKDIGDIRATDRLREIALRSARASNRSVPTRFNRRASYQYRILPSGIPQINFSILSYPNGDSEVLFNWDYRDYGEDPVVLLSRDRDVIHMFSVQFEHLWNAASADHDSPIDRST